MSSLKDAINHFDFQAINLDDVECDYESSLQFADLLTELADYVKVKGKAKELRKDGRFIDIALTLEGRCQQMYDNLPAWAKW